MGSGPRLRVRWRGHAVRVAGLVLLGIGGSATAALSHLGKRGAPPTVALILCAAAAFVGLTIGTAMLIAGGHLLDQVVLGGHDPGDAHDHPTAIGDDPAIPPRP